MLSFRAILLKGIDSCVVLGKIQFVFSFRESGKQRRIFCFWWKNEENSDVERKKIIPCTFFGNVAGVVSGGEITRRKRTMMKMELKNKKENVV